jgi:hypothetical protein
MDRYFVRTLIIGAVLSSSVCCQNYPQGRHMDIQFFRDDIEKPIAFAVEPTPIKPNGKISPSKFDVTTTEFLYTRRHANASRNGRISGKLRHGLWEVADTLGLPKAFSAEEILFGGGKIVVQMEGSWQVRESTGDLIAEGARAPGDMVVDGKTGLLYTNDHTGFIRAWHLETGEPFFALYPLFGSGYYRTLLPARDDRLWIVGNELPVMSHQATREPEFTILEAYTLGEPIRVDGDGLLVSGRQLQSLIVRPEPMLFAASANRLVLAAPDHLFYLDDELDVKADLRAEFTPLALSVDESDHAFMIVKTRRGEAETFAIWAVTPTGDRFIEIDLPSMPGRSPHPPIIGFDGTVYVIIGPEILAIGSDGIILWRQNVAVDIAGTVVMPDGRILVSAGSFVWVIDEAGEKQFLADVGADLLRTPPIPVSNTNLYVASASILYRLRPMEQ